MLGRKPQIHALGKRSRSPDGTWFLPSDMGVVDSHLSGESETDNIECLRLKVFTQDGPLNQPLEAMTENGIGHI